MLTDKELLAAVQSSSAINDPAVRQLARRFAEDVAAMDNDEAAWLERPRRAAASRSLLLWRRFDCAHQRARRTLMCPVW
jgi:hypothetical protein